MNSAFRVHLTRTFVHNLAQGLVFTTWMVFQAQQLGLEPLQLVLVGTMMEITILFFEIPTGVLADVYSRRLSVIIGTFLMGAGFVVMALAGSFEAALLSQLFWGIGYTFTSGAYDAWMVDEVGQDRAGDAFLRGSQVARVAGLMGIILSTILASIQLSLPILAGGLLQIVLAVTLILMMPERGFTPTPREERASWRKWFGTFTEGLRVVRGRPVLTSILGIGFFFGFFSEAWDRLWQVHLIETIGMPGLFEPVVWIGLLAAADAILGAGAVEALRRRLDTGNAGQMTRTLFALTAVMIVAQLGFAMAGGFVFALFAFFAFNIARGLLEPVFSTWTNQQIDSRVRATVLSMQSQTDAIGQIAGGPPLGALGQRSIRLALAASALSLSPALVLLGRVTRRTTDQPVEA